MGQKKRNPDFSDNAQNAEEIMKFVVNFRSKIGEHEFQELMPLTELVFRLCAIIFSGNVPHKENWLTGWIDSSDAPEWNHGERSLLRFLATLFSKFDRNLSDYDSDLNTHLILDVWPAKRW